MASAPLDRHTGEQQNKWGNDRNTDSGHPAKDEPFYGLQLYPLGEG